jgi:NADH:ubiquinone oxidoreductase subunit C
MLHSLDEDKKDEEFDESTYPLLDWEENKYELFGIIYEDHPGKFVAYVLKEDGTQWYLI